METKYYANINTGKFWEHDVDENLRKQDYFTETQFPYIDAEGYCEIGISIYILMRGAYSQGYVEAIELTGHLYL